ncbi:MAG: DUF2304 domain-containing protein [Actinomycetota bacterium]|nr:DUF2304 domain-containing protein [Actinomycetota bacterium]
MTGTQIAALVAGAFALAMIIELLRRRQLREKYAALWLLVGIAMAVLGIFPGLLDVVAAWLGVADPPNLLFFMAILVLLVVSVHLSWELSRLEDETRTLAEEIAFLRLKREAEGAGEPRA